MNAFVMATEQKVISGKAAPFTMMEGRGMLLYGLLALEGAAKIKQMFVVGPKREIMEVLESAIFYCPFSKKISVVDEKTFLAMPTENPKAVQGSALFFPANLPLVSAAEIEQFLSQIPDETDQTYYSCTAEPDMSLFNPLSSDDEGAQQPKLESRYFYRSGQKLTLGHLQYASFKTFVANRKYKVFQGFSKAMGKHKEVLQISDFLDQSYHAVILESGGHSLIVETEDSFKQIAPHFSDWHLKLNQERNIPGDKSCPSPTGLPEA